MAKTKDTLIQEAAAATAALTTAQADAAQQLAALVSVHARETGDLINNHLLALNDKDAKIADLEKKLKAEAATASMWYKAKELVEKELDELHSVLDFLPGAPARERKVKPDDYSATKVSAIARLAGYLGANRAGAQV